MMVGSIGVGYWIAHLIFWCLVGWSAVEWRLRRSALFLGLWLIGYAGSGWVPGPSASMLFVSYVAMLDVALVLLTFKGDLRLT